jgi:predicted transcriptional regulator
LPTKRQGLVGVLILVFAPVGLVSWGAFVLLSLKDWQSSLFLAYTVFLYLLFLLSRVTYDSPRISRIDKTGIDEEVLDLITTTTLKGDRINVAILKSLEKGNKPSQTALYNSVREGGVSLTQQQVREYIVDLEEKGFISSPETNYAKEYQLTGKGKWSREVIDQILPSRMFLYVLRNYMGYRRIPSKPSADPTGQSQGKA